MNRFELDPTSSTPKVFIDFDQGEFRMTGVCVPEDGPGFFGPIINELDHCLPSFKTGGTFKFDLKYFNSSSLKGIYILLKKIDEANTAGKNIEIQWIVESNDEFMTDSASTFSDLVDTPITITQAA